MIFQLLGDSGVRKNKSVLLLLLTLEVLLSATIYHVFGTCQTLCHASYTGALPECSQHPCQCHSMLQDDHIETQIAGSDLPKVTVLQSSRAEI